MFVRCCSLLILATSLALTPANARAQELTGRQILDQSAERHERDFEREVQKMTLIDKAGAREERELRRYARRTDGAYRYLMVFHSPSGVKGSALLTWQNKDKADDQWLYLPAMGDKMKRVAEGGRKNYFMGTDFTFEDLVSESRDKFEYQRQPDETADGVAYYVVDARATDETLKKETGYGSRRLWVRKDNFFIARTDYFDKRAKLIKRQTTAKLAAIDQNTWRAGFSRMENFQENHITEIEIQARDLAEASVDPEIFRERYVTSGKHVR
ncbi:MAG: outer membrane lipoprotein-sorting protein [Rhodospirillales bacterium]|nr:outer membrane lipoprotein-sorting protein [Rhodospirillales bacterium]